MVKRSEYPMSTYLLTTRKQIKEVRALAPRRPLAEVAALEDEEQVEEQVEEQIEVAALIEGLQTEVQQAGIAGQQVAGLVEED